MRVREIWAVLFTLKTRSLQNFYSEIELHSLTHSHAQLMVRSQSLTHTLNSWSSSLCHTLYRPGTRVEGFRA
jgi:hypothetical protein